MRPWRASVAIAVVGASCGSPEPPPPLPPNSFAFGVFGDGPYRAWELGRFRMVVEDANRADLQWFLHVGDILWFPCSDEAYADRLAGMNSIRHPVVYTPGDNEWTDCHDDVAGRFQPLDRLQRIRSMFFAEPGSSLGGRVMRLDSQAVDPEFGEFVENARWRHGGFLFVTIHMVGSDNATRPYRGRTVDDDREVARRTLAALAWLDEAFRIAQSDSLHGIVLALHGNPGFRDAGGSRRGYAEFVQRLTRRVGDFPGQVLLIHGDTHEQRVDEPLVDAEAGRPLANFTRLETFGSPDIGWVRVVVDSVAGRVVEYEPRRMPGWRLW